ncbi:MAG: CapA family protein [Prevotella sp.]|nr:CapA family protein [Prevotella sp.]
MKNFLSVVCLMLISMSCNSTNENGNQIKTDADNNNNNVVNQQRRDNLPDTMTIAMCGDIMMGTTYPTEQLPANDGRDIFADTKEITRRADIALGNLEGALLDDGPSRKGSGPNSYSFRMPTRYGALLTDAGYDYMCMANNHAKDFYDTGIISSEKVLDKEGIKYSGIAGRVESAVVERNGVRYGCCAFGHNSYTMKHSDLALVKRVIDDLRSKSDIVIVTFHGGAEGADRRHLPNGQEVFLGENRGELRKFAHFCIDNGADIVFGHGPHVVRCMEIYKNHLIAYSLGNFCTPYGMSLAGIKGYSPVLELKINSDGTFQSGKIHSFIQQKGVGPRKDPACSVAREIKELTESDIQDSPILIDNEGNITTKK